MNEALNHSKKLKSIWVIFLIAIVWDLQLVGSIFIGITEAEVSFFEMFAYAIGEASIILLVIILSLKILKVSAPVYLINPNEDLKQQALFGVLLGLIITAAIFLVIHPVLYEWFPTQNKRIALSQYFTDILYLPFWLVLALFKGGIVEELWRTFTIKRFEIQFGRVGQILALILSTIIFAFGHFYQGLSGMIGAGIVGLIYGIVFIFRKSTLELIVAHATRDLLSVIFGYAMFNV